MFAAMSSRRSLPEPVSMDRPWAGPKTEMPVPPRVFADFNFTSSFPAPVLMTRDWIWPNALIP